MSNATFEPEEPGAINFTLTYTARLADWIKLSHALDMYTNQHGGDGAILSLSRAISDMARQATQIYRPFSDAESDDA